MIAIFFLATIWKLIEQMTPPTTVPIIVPIPGRINDPKNAPPIAPITLPDKVANPKIPLFLALLLNSFVVI